MRACGNFRVFGRTRRVSQERSVKISDTAANSPGDEPPAIDLFRLQGCRPEEAGTEDIEKKNPC